MTTEQLEMLVQTLKDVEEHMDYIGGWGDNWEREWALATNLPSRLNTAIGMVTAELQKLLEFHE